MVDVVTENVDFGPVVVSRADLDAWNDLDAVPPSRVQRLLDSRHRIVVSYTNRGKTNGRRGLDGVRRRPRAVRCRCVYVQISSFIHAKLEFVPGAGASCLQESARFRDNQSIRR